MNLVEEEELSSSSGRERRNEGTNGLFTRGEREGISKKMDKKERGRRVVEREGKRGV